jgi:molybdopterin molybdotransferase
MINTKQRMLSVKDALSKVKDGVQEVSSEQVALPDALGRVLAYDVSSRLTYPPVAISAMDGYAVKASDLINFPVTLRKIGEAAAGASFQGVISPGETVRIFTGAPLPAGADTIIIQEIVSVEENNITFKEGAPKGTFVRSAGLDFLKGDVLLEKGQILTARDLGLAAAMNVPWLDVRRLPRIAYTATGDEIVMPGDPLGSDQIISSNSIALGGYIKTLGGVPINLGIARDNEESLRNVFDGALGVDMLVTLGGASVGDYDLVQKVLNSKGMDLSFYRVAMRPGKPLIFGHLGEIPVLGLPGNPVSAGVTSVIFLKAAMSVMLGLDDKSSVTSTALLGCKLEANDFRQDYLRSSLTTNAKGNLVATPFERQDSSMMELFAKADCLVVRSPEAIAASEGDTVEIILLGSNKSLF